MTPVRLLELTRSVLNARWFVGLLGASLLALLVWLFGPGVAINGHAPLASEPGRLVTILGISLLWGAGNLWTLRRARAQGEAMAEALARPTAGPTAAPAADAELAAVAARFKEAMARLKAHRFAKGRLHELPWYVMIGPPGSGKTTALLQSGLRFPLEGAQELKGVGGTRHCDWFFADEAVLLDTAGRWTTQDSDRAADAAAWLGFLDLLRRHRPREPINGVIVALAVDDLAGDPARLEAAARAARARLAELGARLGLSVPAYLLVTKADLLAGFRETFADLDERAREQVWGFTLPVAEPGGAPPRELVQGELDLLVERLGARLLDRLEAERGPDRRASIQAFPLQVAALAAPLRQFLDEAFGGTSYETPPLLRGVYFTSGTQAGTPIDRLLGGLQRRFGLRLGPTRARDGDRSFFLTRLLREVIFAEAPLVRRASRLERRERRHARLAWGLATAAVPLVVGGWIWAYRAQTGAVEAYTDGVRAYLAQAATVATDAVGPQEEDLRPVVLPVLDSARSLAATAPEPAVSFGLSQADRLRDRGAEVYGRALHDILLPRLVLLVETRLRAELRQPDAAVADSLKVYLGLGGQGTLPAALVTAWFAEDWRRAYPLDEASRDRLGRHLAALLEELPAAEVRPQLDGELIRSARAAIDRVPLSKRAYLALTRKHGAAGQAFEPLEVAGPEASALFPAGTDSALAAPIPELFTRRGFWQRFLPAMVPAMRAAVAEHAATRPGQPEPDERGQARLIREMLELYHGDAIERWQKVERGLGFRLPGSLDDAASVLRPLAVPPSPLTQLLQAMVDATRLTVPPEPPAGEGAAGEGRAGSPTANGIPIREILARLGEPSPPLGEPVEVRFRPLARAVTGEGGAPTRLERVLAAANELYHALPPPGAPPPLPAEAGQIKVQAGRLAEAARGLPAPLGEQLAALAERVDGMAEIQALARLNDAYRAKVMPFCRQATAGRFPFDRGSAADASLADLGRLFGTGGLFDQFIDQQLAPYVDTARRPWRWRQPIGSPDGALAPFELARRLRDGVFAGGTMPRAGFTLKPIGLDENTKRVDLDLDGQTVSYARGGPAAPVHLDWPSPSGSRRVQLRFVPRGWWTTPVTRSEEGPWSWPRLLHEAGLSKQGRPDLYGVTLAAGPHRASFRLEADSVDNPFDLEPFRRFRCPDGL
jgi:type VI secretion system protein ImpL